MSYIKKHPFNIALLSALFLLLSCAGNNKQQAIATSAENGSEIVEETVIGSQTVEAAAEENQNVPKTVAKTETATEKVTDNGDNDRIYYFKDLKEMGQTSIMKGNPQRVFQKEQQI